MPKQASDIIAILTEDHDKVLRLFAEFQEIKDKVSDIAKQKLVETACTELVIHAQVEEEYLYPALRDAFDELDLLDEAAVEHTIARQLIGQLEAMQAGDNLYDAWFTVLGEYVKHHIAEEQNRIFPLMAKATLASATLARDIRHRRDELRSEFGMPDQGFDDDDEGGRYPLHSGKSVKHSHH